MKTRLLLALAATIPMAAALAEDAPSTPPPPPSVMPVVAPMSAAECEVWAREKSFAAASAAHDTAAFTEHVHPGAVFVNGNQAPSRGRAKILEDWAPIIEGKDIHLGWYPGFVAIGGDDHLAISRGPYWIENPDPTVDPAKRYRVGNFQSIWVRDKDGQWRVFVDGGTGPSRPSSAEEVAALKAQLPPECPRA
jgi:ketosteroid isomerase-like protein